MTETSDGAGSEGVCMPVPVPSFSGVVKPLRQRKKAAMRRCPPVTSASVAQAVHAGFGIDLEVDHGAIGPAGTPLAEPVQVL